MGKLHLWGAFTMMAVIDPCPAFSFYAIYAFLVGLQLTFSTKCCIIQTVTREKKSKVTPVKAYFVLFLSKKTNLFSDCSRR